MLVVGGGCGSFAGSLLVVSGSVVVTFMIMEILVGDGGAATATLIASTTASTTAATAAASTATSVYTIDSNSTE